MAQYSTDPGGRSVEEIERDVDEERARVSDTIGALQEKMSVGNLIDQAMHTFAEQGGAAGRNLGNTLRDNPVPAILTGVGLVWLMASSGRRSEDRGYRDYPEYPEYEDDRYDYSASRYYGGRAPEDLEVWEEDEEALAEEGQSEPLHRGHPVSAATGGSPGVTRPEASDSPGFGERASEAWSGTAEGATRAWRGTAERASRSWSGAAEGASRAWSGAAGGAGSAASSLAERGRRAGGAMRRAGRGASSGARHMGHRARHAGYEARETLGQVFDDHPLVLAGLALALGAAVGGALPRTRTEDELFGERSRDLKRGLRSAAEQEGRKAYATAGAVADEARTMADEAASSVAREGSAMVDRAEEAIDESAARLRDRAREEAEAQRLGKPDVNT